MEDQKLQHLREKLGISSHDQKQALGKELGQNLQKKVSGYTEAGGNFVSAPPGTESVAAGGNFVSAPPGSEQVAAGGNFVSAPPGTESIAAGGNFVSAPPGTESKATKS
ncbi:MAG: hypothetical protein F4W92_09270 [Gammaproteobacteria bacterium]|nr:hypothetical protein [Gammaproteobacteria bacterium]